MGDIDELLKEELQDPEFAKAWEETEQEYQMKRKCIEEKIEKNNIAK